MFIQSLRIKVSHVEEIVNHPPQKSHSYTYSEDENISLERAYFDYYWEAMNSGRVESGKMGAMSSDRKI